MALADRRSELGADIRDVVRMDQPADQLGVPACPQIFGSDSQHPLQLLGAADGLGAEIDLPAPHSGEPLGLVLQRLAALELLPRATCPIELQVRADASEQLP